MPGRYRRPWIDATPQRDNNIFFSVCGGSGAATQGSEMTSSMPPGPRGSSFGPELGCSRLADGERREEDGAHT